MHCVLTSCISMKLCLHHANSSLSFCWSPCAVVENRTTSSACSKCETREPSSMISSLRGLVSKSEKYMFHSTGDAGSPVRIPASALKLSENSPPWRTTYCMRAYSIRSQSIRSPPTPRSASFGHIAYLGDIIVFGTVIKVDMHNCIKMVKVSPSGKSGHSEQALTRH